MDHDQRLRRDARSLAGDPEVVALYECLTKHIFDPAFDLAFLARLSGAPRPVRDRLAAKIGPLKVYVTKLRMAEAKRLVLDTRMPIAEIAKRVGYTVERTFRRTFHSAHGVNPSELRQRARMTGDAGDDAPAESEATEPARTPLAEDSERLTRLALGARLRRRRELGMLDAAEAAELRLELRRRHPRLDQEDAAQRTEPPGQEPAPEDRQWPVLLTPTGDWLEEIACNSALGEILDLPEDDQRFALLHGLRLGNVTAFFQLHRFCCGLLQFDGERAVKLARLGVELIETHREHMGEEADDWKALAWVHLAQIQTHTGDRGGADQSLGFAGAEVGGEDVLKGRVEIELRRVEGAIKKQQRRYLEAEVAMDRALELARQLEVLDPKRRMVVLERLELASTVSDACAGFDLITELEELIAAFPDGDERRTWWRGQVFFHGAKAHVANGRECCAERCLRQAMDDVIADPRCDSDRQLGMLFTFIVHDLARLHHGDRLDAGEKLLRAVVERYRWLEIPVLEAAAEAELAAVCAIRGRRAEARRLATSAADFLDDLPPLHREARLATRRLRALANGDAAAGDELEGVLAKLRRDLDLVAWEITGPQAMLAARARWQQTEAPETRTDGGSGA